jgi:hypothetical protein
VLPLHLPGRAEEKHEKSVGMTGVRAEIWTQDLPNNHFATTFGDSHNVYDTLSPVASQPRGFRDLTTTTRYLSNMLMHCFKTNYFSFMLCTCSACHVSQTRCKPNPVCYEGALVHKILNINNGVVSDSKGPASWLWPFQQLR